MAPSSFFISVLISFITATSFTLSHGQCLQHHKSLLLQLKNELIFDSSNSTKLVQWNRTNDCCNWHGVECDGAGHVTSLQLDHEAISGGIEDSSSLFRLNSLEKLNLAFNTFNHTRIPRGIQNLTYLTHLNLSYADFSGQVPLELSFLKRLVSLDISTFRRGIEPLKLDRPNLETLLRNLSGLRELYLDGVDISSQKSEWAHIISSCLPNLRSLSLRYCSVSGPLHEIESLLKLQSLSILILDGNQLSSAVPNLFANFSSLTTLRLKNCSLEGSFPEIIFQNPTLQNLDLSQNILLSGSMPPFTQNGSLRSMILSQTNFSGSIPSSISNLKSLSHIDLSYSKFTGPIPSTFGNLTKLTDVILWANFFTGSLPSTFFRGLSNLDTLILACNSFTGYVPQSLFDLPSLRVIDLQDNKFVGQIGEFPVGNVSSIVTLDMSRNLLQGHVPISLFQIQSLENLVLSHNLLSGNFQVKNIRSPNLEVLDLSYNNLSVDANVDPTWHGFPKLRELGLASCDLRAFPELLKHAALVRLDLSNNGIEGEIPSWIWGTQLYIMNLSCNLLTDLQKPYQIPASLVVLDLHSNRFKGDLGLAISPIGDLTPSLSNLYLANNGFSGSIPASLCKATQLGILDLSLNQLSGDIPPCLVQNTWHIQVLNLGRNNISGRIPDNFPPECGLQNLDLNNNAIQGNIPKSLQSCKSLEMMNVGYNSIDDTFPCMLPPSLSVLVLRSNRFHGEVTCERGSTWPNLQIIDISSNNFNGSLESINFSSWTSMVLMSDARFTQRHTGTNFLSFSQFYYTAAVALTIKRVELELVKIWPDFIAIDFSCNDFHGDVPEAIGDLTSLYVLNISHNALGGSIPKSLGRLSKLESLDLSRNRLSGHVPTELGGLTFLSVLNVSYNELVGEIPNGRQMHTFSADSFQGNAGLCGRPLDRNCSEDGSGRGRESQEEVRIEWTYVFAALGYVVGLGIIVWMLIFCRSFREKYFAKIDEILDEIFDGSNRVLKNQVRTQ